MMQDTFHQPHALLADTLKAACRELRRKAPHDPGHSTGWGGPASLGLVDRVPGGHRCGREDARRFQADLRQTLAFPQGYQAMNVELLPGGRKAGQELGRRLDFGVWFHHFKWCFGFKHHTRCLRKVTMLFQFQHGFEGQEDRPEQTM